MMMVVLIFIVCWLPYHTYFITANIYPEINHSEYIQEQTANPSLILCKVWALSPLQITDCARVKKERKIWTMILGDLSAHLLAGNVQFNVQSNDLLLHESKVKWDSGDLWFALVSV